MPDAPPCRRGRPRLAGWGLLAAALLLAWPGGRACAKPASASLEQVLNLSEVIAVARFCGEGTLDLKHHRVKLELTRVLKGDLRPGKYTATFADRPRVGGDCPEFVAFFRPGLCWRFAAWPISKDNHLADGVLRVEGFYDWNAYFVSPGLVTLSQLEALVQGRPLRYKLRGPLHFPRRGRPGWQASPLVVEVDYDATAEAVTVRGLPELKGFPAQPEVFVDAAFAARPEVTLTWSRRGDMPLVLRGEVRSFDSEAGVMRADFFVRQPAVVSLEDFKAYATDPRKGHSYFRCKMSCDRPAPGADGPRLLTLTLGQHLGRREVLLDGWADRPLDAIQISYQAPDRQSVFLAANVAPEVFASLPPRERSLTAVFPLESGEEGEYLLLRFEVGPPGAWEEVGKGLRTPGLLLGLLLGGDVRGAAYVYREGKAEEATAFTAALEGVYHARLDTPRTDVVWAPERSRRETGGIPHMEAYVLCGPDEEEGAGGLALGRWWPAGAAAAVLAAGTLLWMRRRRRARGGAPEAPGT